MNGLEIAVISYLIACIISFLVAGLIQLMGSVLTGYVKDRVTVPEAVTAEVPSDDSSSDVAAIAAAIAIVKNAV
jgi:Na+-transporting methylmalonyl-CoA/oxaloacetate decarboxylase gamma subunit